MKVDLENKSELRRKRSELIKWIAVIDLALGDTPSNGSISDDRSWVVPTALASIFDDLGDEFTSSDVYSRIDESKRPSIKLALKTAANDGLLTITQNGKGRRPTVYRKN